MTGRLYRDISYGTVKTCKTALCHVAVKLTLDLLEGGHQSFSCSSPSSKKRADKNLELHGLILVMGNDSGL